MDKNSRVLNGLHSLFMLAFELEKLHLYEPSFDPSASPTAEQIIRVLESLDDSVLDALAVSAENSRQRDLFLAKLNKTVAERTSSEEFIESRSSDPQLAAAMETPLDVTGDLLNVLKADLPLSSGMIYRAVSPKGGEYAVEISRDIVAEDSGAEHRIVRRLLKSLFHGTGAKSGLKNLFDIGPRIVELKAFVAGHKRLIGCLEGRRLRLLKYDSMPVTRAGYFRLIPSDLCK